MIGTLSTPAIVSVLGGSTSGITVPGDETLTLTGAFPSFSALSSDLTILTSTSWPAPISIVPSTPLTATSGVATVASVVSLSDGLGPLLSSTTSTTDLGLTLSPLPDTSSTSIQVISSTLTPTAVSSELTTSGIPDAFSVQPSLISSNTILKPSAALISFGTSSPAVYSTVLPSGTSRGTSSNAFATYSTIALQGVTLTGVTLLAPRSPTSCFTLPTPVSSMDMLAVAVIPEDTYDLSNPIIFGFGANGTIPQYVMAISSGNPYVLNLSPDNPVHGQLGLQIPGDGALVFDGSGMSLYTGNCTTLTQVAIDNFYSQLASIAGASPSLGASKGMQKLQGVSSSNFTVVVSVDSYLNSASFGPKLTFGNTQCTLQSNVIGTSTDSLSWSCIYPPPEGDAAVCATGLGAWMSDMSTPSTSPRNTTQVLATIGPFLSVAGDAILNLFPGADPALSLGLAFMQQVENAIQEAINGVGISACDVLHAYDYDDLVIEDSGPLGTQTIGSFMSAPPPSIAVNLKASATASITALPRRKANPTDNFLKQIATDFSTIFGAFTSWLHGLPHLTLGIFGVEETGSLQTRTVIANPTGSMAITPTTALVVPTVMQTQMPTVTVTHVLGDGWFNPSTYLVGVESSTISQVSAVPTHGSGFSTPSDITSIMVEEYLNTSSSTLNFVSSNLVDHVVAQLAAMEFGDAGVQTGHRWDLPNPQSSETGITTAGASLGYDGHIVVVTTTITVMNGNYQ